MRAVVIPVEGRIQEVEFRENDPGQWAGLVGSAYGVDFITLREQGLQVIVDDHSIPDGRPLNVRMTWFLRGTGRWMSEVYGTVLLVGIDPDDGDTREVPDMLTAVMVSMSETPG